MINFDQLFKESAEKHYVLTVKTLEDFVYSMKDTISCKLLPDIATLKSFLEYGNTGKV